MGIIDKLLGREEPTQNPSQFNAQPAMAQPAMAATGMAATGAAPNRPMDADAQAVARYRYMLQTAPPEQIEAAHAEAFARLTPEQRRLALQQLSQTVPENERAALRDDPRSLAQAATRAEIRQPGALQSAFNQPMQGGQMAQQGGMMGGMGGGGMGGMMGGMGGMLAGGLLASVAGGFIGSSIANSFFSNPMHESGFMQDAQAQGFEPVGYDQINDISSGQAQEMNEGLSATDPMGDPADQSAFQETGGADTYGDPADAGFDGGGFDSGGFDSGGFDI